LESDIDSFYISSLGIPAWTVAEVREEGLNTDLLLRFLKDEFGFAALLWDRIVAPHIHHSKWIAVVGDPVTNIKIVTKIDSTAQQSKNH
jgi:hypothetical protein